MCYNGLWKMVALAVSECLWQLAITAGRLDMVRIVHDHGVPIRCGDYAFAAITGDLAIVQWLQGSAEEVEYRQERISAMTIAAGCAAAHGHLEVLKWLTVERDDGVAPGEVAYWGRYILLAAAKGGHVHIIEWAHHFGYPSNHTKQEWARAANQAKAAAESVQRQRAGQPPPRKMPSTSKKRVRKARKEAIEMRIWLTCNWGFPVSHIYL
jgi:hypothetical protein